MQKIRPILFSTPMVEAILEGRKTMTRRVAKRFVQLYGIPEDKKDNGKRIIELGVMYKTMTPPPEIGDILWVRETFKPKRFAGHILPGYDYKADHVSWLEKNGQEFTPKSGCENGENWKPCLFMPKQACRIWLEVTNVRLERLQDISEENSIAEGVYLNYPPNAWRDYMSNNHSISGLDTAKKSFFSLWEKINGKESVSENPWVWVYEFKKVEMPINFLN